MADIQEEAAMENEESQNTAAEDGESGEKPETESEPVEQTEENSGDQETKDAAAESGEAGEDHAADGEGASMGEKPSVEEGGEGQTQDAESKEDQEVAVEEQQSGEGVQAENEDGEVEQTVAEPSDVVEGEAVENVDVVDPSATDAVPDSGTGEEAEGAGEAAPAESGELAETNEAEEQGEETAAGAPSAVVEEGEGEAKEAEGEGEEQAAGEGGEEQAEESKEGEEGEGEESGPAQEVGSETAVIDDENKAPSPVGQELSRGPTPDDAAAVQLEYQRLEATTPDRIDETDELGYIDGPGDDEREAVMVEEEEEPEFRRDELIEKYHEALADREQLQQQNYSLQHKLAEYFRKKKADERQDYDKNVTDQEQRYLKYMAQLEDLRRQDMTEKENYQIQIEDAKDRCQERKEKVDLERKKFMDFKKQVALNAINSRSGKPIPPKDIEQYMVNEMKKEQEVVNVRLENIKLKNKLKKKEQQLKSKEELAEGLHLIDFEQLKIENQTYNEKIEERNEELLKLRKKITSTVQVLTHLKEKLQFVQGENLDQSNTLKEVESSLAQSRDILSRTKQARDALRIDNQKLRQSCGLLGNEPLLRDFEERKDESDDLRGKLEELRMRHAELTLHCNQVRRKIDQVRQGMH